MSINFSDMPPDNCLMVVDSLNLAFRYKHSGATDFHEDYLETVNSLKRSYKAKYVILACDQGSSSYRKSLFPGYKQKRKDSYKTQTDAERAIFELFFEDFNKTLAYISENSNYPIIKFNGVEADDIAAYICSKNKKVDHTWLISTDRDWDLLVSENTSRFSYLTRKEITLDNWYSNYGCPPDEYISYKCLIGDCKGDSSDNIPGVEGIGEKRAVELLQQYGSALDIVASLPIQSHLKHIKNLNNSKETILLNYKLMDLVTFNKEAIGEDNIKIIDNILEEYLDAQQI